MCRIWGTFSSPRLSAGSCSPFALCSGLITAWECLRAKLPEMGTAAVPQPDHSKKWLSDPGLRWKAASGLVAFYIVSVSNNQKIVEVQYGCQSEQNQREQIIILIIIATFASNLFDMRVCSKSPQTGAIIWETVMRLLGAGGENCKCTRLCHVVCHSLHSSLTPTHLHAEQSPTLTDKTSSHPQV